MEEDKKITDFVRNELPRLILESNDDMKNHQIISVEAIPSTTLNGFMSSIVTLNLVTESRDNPGVEIPHKIMVKLMKGDVLFRTSSKSYQQFSNEIYIYKKVIPYFKQVVAKCGGTSSINVDEFIPKVYYADYGLYPGLGDGYQSILALENLNASGYRNGPRLDLDEPHLRLAVKLIAEYHSVSYAMRLTENENLVKLKKGLIELPFKEPNGGKNIFWVIYRIGFDRYFEYLERSPQYENDERFMKEMKKMKEYYFEEPLDLVEKIRKDDPLYSVILHGDYNRNNVLFQYESDEGFDGVKNIKTIDFQEVRYGTPAMDLSFFLYFGMCGMDDEQFDKLWDELIDLYHDNLLTNIANILNVPKDDKKLEPYFYDNFMKHLRNRFLYGVLVAFQFLFWMMCSEEECARITKLFEDDMLSDDFHKYCMVAGGDEPNERLVKMMKHAIKKGYTQIL